MSAGLTCEMLVTFKPMVSKIFCRENHVNDTSYDIFVKCFEFICICLHNLVLPDKRRLVWRSELLSSDRTLIRPDQMYDKEM